MELKWKSLQSGGFSLSTDHPREYRFCSNPGNDTRVQVTQAIFVKPEHLKAYKGNLARAPHLNSSTYALKANSCSSGVHATGLVAPVIYI